MVRWSKHLRASVDRHSIAVFALDRDLTHRLKQSVDLMPFDIGSQGWLERCSRVCRCSLSRRFCGVMILPRLSNLGPRSSGGPRLETRHEDRDDESGQHQHDDP
jgi:hypothetical protein